MPFLSTGIDVRTVNLSHLLNPDWSIQIFPAPAVCKAKKYTVNQGCMSLCQPVIWSMAAMLRDSDVVVVRTRPRAIPLAMITMRKTTHGFPFVSHIWDAYGAPLSYNKLFANWRSMVWELIDTLFSWSVSELFENSLFLFQFASLRAGSLVWVPRTGEALGRGSPSKQVSLLAG